MQYFSLICHVIHKHHVDDATFHGPDSRCPHWAQKFALPLAPQSEHSRVAVTSVFWGGIGDRDRNGSGEVRSTCPLPPAATLSSRWVDVLVVTGSDDTRDARRPKEREGGVIAVDVGEARGPSTPPK